MTRKEAQKIANSMVAALGDGWVAEITDISMLFDAGTHFFAIAQSTYWEVNCALWAKPYTYRCTPREGGLGERDIRTVYDPWTAVAEGKRVVKQHLEKTRDDAQALLVKLDLA